MWVLARNPRLQQGIWILSLKYDQHAQSLLLFNNYIGVLLVKYHLFFHYYEQHISHIYSIKIQGATDAYSFSQTHTDWTLPDA